MSTPLAAGVFELSLSDHKPTTVRVLVWQAPAFARFDDQMKLCQRLAPLQSIFVERRCDVYSVGKPRVRYENGDEIGQYTQARLPQWLRNRIDDGKRETLRIAGGSRRKANQWYKK